MSFKMFVVALAGLAAMPALAQETGPSGLAEPRVRQSASPVDVAQAQAQNDVPKAEPANILNIQLSTGGVVSIQLRPDKAPLSVERIKTLAGRGFYNNLVFHRVIDGFMAQGGDPKGTGEGGSELPDLKAEFNDLPHVRGALAMARAESPDSANSQYYIVLSPSLNLDNRYTVIGRVIAGMPYVDKIEKGEPPANPSRMVRVWIGAAPVGAEAATPPIAAPAPAALPPLPPGPTSLPPTPPRRR